MVLRIAIDAISLSHPQHGGYHTYAVNLLHALAQIDTTNEYWLLMDRPVTWNPGPNWHLFVLSAPFAGAGVAWREQVTLPQQIARLGVHLFHAPAATGPLWGASRAVATIHDTIEFTDPLPSPLRTKRWAMRVYSRHIQIRLAHKVRQVITISEYSRQRVAARLGLPMERISAIPLAPSAAYYPLDRADAAMQVAQRWRVRDYVLALASAAPRKNVGRLLQAYARLDPGVRRRYPLLLICTHVEQRATWAAQAAALGIGHQVLMLDHIADADLLLLYNAAALFVFPSLEEGFGLPPLEAMACGTSVIASNTSSLPEVLGDAALLVSPTDIEELAGAIAAVLTNPSLAADLAQRGLQRSKQFSWTRTARQTLALYESVVASG